MKNQIKSRPVADTHTPAEANDYKRAESFSFSFESTHAPASIFRTLLDIKAWWSGIYGEKIEGASSKVNDEFTFTAGNGAHYSKQRLIELLPDTKVVWLVCESNLSFLKKPDEWVNTKICFELSQQEDTTQVKFSHLGLVPGVEGYEGGINAWTKYLEIFAERLA